MYEFQIRKWFKPDSNSIGNPVGLVDSCITANGKVPEKSELNNEANIPKVGTLWAEWGKTLVSEGLVSHPTIWTPVLKQRVAGRFLVSKTMYSPAYKKVSLMSLMANLQVPIFMVACVFLNFRGNSK